MAYICLCLVNLLMWYLMYRKEENDIEELTDKIFDMESEGVKHLAEQKHKDQDYRNSLRLLAKEIKKWKH